MDRAAIYTAFAALFLALFAYFLFLGSNMPRSRNDVPKVTWALLALIMAIAMMLMTRESHALPASRTPVAGCEYALQEKTLSDLLNTVMAKRSPARQTYLLQGISQQFNRESFAGLKELMKEKFGVNLKYKGVQKEQSWVRIYFEISGKRAQLLPALMSFNELEANLRWLDGPRSPK